ncbi:Hypothetical predicted protein [Marmota monax]|uniref:Nanos-type domain-containing protein n=1 Tax=Marmota monax TaxID=9995 RepID=A0A5E4DA04_MARMO|nr:Hypothetical predicted protein [Marmota monax]
MLITRAVDGEPRFRLRPWRGLWWRLSALFVVLVLLLPPHGGRARALGPADYDKDYDEDNDRDEPGSWAASWGSRWSYTRWSYAHAPSKMVTPREERARAWATDPRLQATSGTAAAWLLKPELQVCVFCGNNKEAVALYTTHILKGPDGRVLCPVLRRYTCPL